MVLYNGQFNDGGGDFVCFGLSEGYPEFRFDVGSGPAVIRGNRTLDLNQWHTVKLTRNRKKGKSYFPTLVMWSKNTVFDPCTCTGPYA